MRNALILLSALVSTQALAAPDGYKLTKSDVAGCNLFLGPADSEGDVPMRAECHWADVTLDTFKKNFSDWPHHADMFSTVAESKVQRSGDKQLVFQRHTTSGISDREILLWGTHSVVDGYDRYEWSKAQGEALTVSSSNVACERSDGYWQAKASDKGGIDVIHELRYDPGGRVPGFMVRWFQTSGLEATVTEARAAMK